MTRVEVMAARDPRRRLPLFLALLLPTTSPGATAGPQTTDQIVDELCELVDEQAQELIELRRDLHRHPELSGQEERTARIVAERLRAAGLEVRTGVGGHGVVATLEGGREGPVVGYRADMDAVPSGFQDPVEFRSENPGVRHICGHDIHTTVGVGVAEALATLQDDLPGTVRFFFQPAEETGTGARAMLADGALQDGTPDAIFALHTSPLPAGQIGAVEGPTLAGRDRVEVRLHGDGDLEGGAERVVAAIRSAGAVPAPASPAALAALPLTDQLSVGTIASSRELQDGDTWRILGGLSFATEEARLQAKQRLVDRLEALELADVALEVEYTDRLMDGAFSDPELVRGTYPAIRAALGESGLVVVQGAGPTFSEDFGAFLVEAPGAMYWLGVGAAGLPHSPGYVADESSIAVGAKAMAAVLYDFLATH